MEPNGQGWPWANSARTANPSYAYNVPRPNVGLVHTSQPSANSGHVLNFERSRNVPQQAPVSLPQSVVPFATNGPISTLDPRRFVDPGHLGEPRPPNPSAGVFGSKPAIPMDPHRPKYAGYPQHAASIRSHKAPENATRVNTRPTMHVLHSFPTSSIARVPQIPRLNLLHAWRARTGLVSPTSYAPQFLAEQASKFPSSRNENRGGLLPLSILERIARDLLSMAPLHTHPRLALGSLAIASKRFRSVAAPFIYEHVALRNNGDLGVYARAGSMKHVRRLTICFDPYAPRNPDSVLMDANLGLCWSSLQGHNASGTLHRFPQCQEVRLVSRNASEALQPVQYQGADYLAAILVQLVYPTVSRVILETDMADMSAMFTTRLIKREGPADSKVVLEIQTKRDEVVRSVERAICSHVPQCTDPQSPRMHIIVRGPTYGTDFILDESTRVSRITQRMWREKATEPEASHSDRNKGRAQLRMEDEDHEVLGAKELVASLSRRNAIPAKRKIADVANQVPLRRSPRQKSHKWSNAPLVPSQPRMILPKPKRALPPRPSSIRCTSTSSENAASGGPGCSTVSLSQPNEPFFEQAPLPRQTPARYAGKLAAGMPAIVEQVMQQLTNEDLRNQRPNSCCPKLPQRVVGVEDPVARAELDMFVGTYYARRYAAQCRLANLAKMKELREEAKAKPDHSKQADDIAGRDGKVVGDAAEGPISKRRRRA